MSRILTALVAVPLLLAVILAGPAWLFLALALACSVVGYWELDALGGRLGWKLLPVGYPGTAFLVVAFHPSFPAVEEACLALVLFVGLSAVFARAPSRETLGSVTATFLGALYVGACLGSLVGVRMTEPDRSGRLWILFLLAVVMVGDAGAFYVGRALGRTPLAPVLSPKKTVEGLVGGVLFSVATAVGLRALTFPELRWNTALGLGLSLALLGVVGDLFESLLKRSADVKDTSSLFPGHGGMLDRIDSVLFAAPLLYLFLKWG